MNRRKLLIDLLCSVVLTINFRKSEWESFFIESLDKGIWDINGPFIPKQMIDGTAVDKPWSEWSAEESKRAQFDCIAKNIVTSALNVDEFFRVSQCSSAKEMWDVLEVTHSWRNKWCQEGKEACVNSRIWTVSHAGWRINCRSVEKVHTHSESPHWTWQDFWQGGTQHQSAKVSGQSLAAQGHCNYRVKGSYYFEHNCTIWKTQGAWDWDELAQGVGKWREEG